MHLILIGLLLGLVNASFAQEFHNFQLKGALKELRDESIQTSLKSADTRQNPAFNEQRRQINAKLLKLALPPKENSYKVTNKGGFLGLGDDQSSSIFDGIMNELADQYQNIGDTQINPLVQGHQFGGGVQNFAGMSWHKPMGTFIYEVNREVTPKIGGTYIVHDKLVIGINATTFLTNMADEGLIDITQDGLAAFAGLGFTRTYHTYKTASSYAEGMRSDYQTLFFPFKYHQTNVLLNYSESALFKKEDHFHIQVGAAISTPSFYGLSASAGAMFKLAHSNHVSLERLSTDEEARNDGEFLRVSSLRSFDTSTIISLSAQLDFYQILKFTIFEFDLSYEYGKSKSNHLSFKRSDINEIQENYSKRTEFTKLIKGFIKRPRYWAHRIVQYEDILSKALKTKLGLFLFGTLRKKETEKIVSVKDGVARTFFRAYDESTQYIENFFTKLISGFLGGVLNLGIGNYHNSERSRILTLDYEKKSHLNHFEATDTESFSFKVSRSFAAQKTHRKILHRGLRKKAARFIVDNTNFDTRIASMIYKRQLVGPIELNTQWQIGTKALNYFHRTSIRDIKGKLYSFCQRIRIPWYKIKRRQKRICYRRLKRRYLSYIEEYMQRGVMDLEKFQAFMLSYVDRSHSVSDMEHLFGHNNVFIQGQISAVTKEGLPFRNFFNQGEYEDLGVINRYMAQVAEL